MATQNPNDIRNKASSIASIMKNKKLAKTVLAAWNAPVGSTKNINARKILRSLNKANTNYGVAMNDGQGGAADWVNQYFVNPLKDFYNKTTAQPSQAEWDARQQTANQQNTQFIQSIDNLIRAPEDPTMLGTSRLGRTITAGAGAISQGIAGAGELLGSAVKAPSQVFPTISKVIMPGINWLMEDPEAVKISTTPTPTPVVGKYENLVDVNGEIQTKDGRKFGEGKTAQEAQAELAQYLGIAPHQIEWGKIEKPTTDRKTITVQGRKIYADTGQPVEGKLGETQISQAPPIGTEQLPSGQYQYNYDPGDTVFNQLAGVTAPEGTELRKAQEAYASGMGATAFVMQELLDKEALGKRLGMSPEAAATLPNVFLQDSLDKIEGVLNDEYKIDEMRNHLTNKINQGLTLEQDYSDYIKGKDEYLGKIDSLLDNAYDKIAKMDTSNPYVAARVKNYTGYLTILKGRQNKRYIDFLNMATTQWNAELTQETNLYNSNLAAYNKALTSQTARTTEWDATVRNMLKEMYNSVEKMEDRIIKLDEAERDKLKDNTSIALDILKLQSGGDVSQTDKDRALKIAALQKYVPAQNADGYVDASSYTEKRTMYVLETGDASTFDEAYSPYLTPQDRATLGVGKAVGETATPEKTIEEVIKEYEDQGYTREEIEKIVSTDDKGNKVPVPVEIEKILDDLYGKKKSGLFGWGTGFGL